MTRRATALAAPTDLSKMTKAELEALRAVLMEGALDDLGAQTVNDDVCADLDEIQVRIVRVDQALGERRIAEIMATLGSEYEPPIGWEAKVLTEKYGVLQCPACRGTLMHHDEVNVFEREQDAILGLKVRVLGVDLPTREYRAPEVGVGDALTGNPSARRGGIAIHFWCESCSVRSLLTIVQHKGMTLLELK